MTALILLLSTTPARAQRSLFHTRSAASSHEYHLGSYGVASSLPTVGSCLLFRCLDFRVGPLESAIKTSGDQPQRLSACDTRHSSLSKLITCRAPVNRRDPTTNRFSLRAKYVMHPMNSSPLPCGAQALLVYMNPDDPSWEELMLRALSSGMLCT